MLEKLKTLYQRYEHRITPVAFLTGFVWDNLTLTRIDLLYDNLVITVYLVIAGTGIAVRNAYDTGRLRMRFWDQYHTFLPLLMQFAFGGLFSGFFVFYSRSGTLAGSWPFLLFLAALLVGNEFFRKQYARIVFLTSIFFVTLFSYAILIIPVLTEVIGASTFLLSGLVSVFVIVLFLVALLRERPTRIFKTRPAMVWSIGSIFVAFNLLYFSNIIPPIPLSLKEIGVYHSVTRINGDYTVVFEPAPWYLFFGEERNVFHRQRGKPVYVWSAVFAPTDLKTKIFHRWSFYDEERREWIETDRIAFPIVGGRDGGYRGFSFKQNVFEGRWRVDVITERGQLIGRKKFRVVAVRLRPQLETVVR